MGDLPRILARTDVPNAPAFPRVPAGAMGAPWATLAEIGKAMQEKQKPIDAAKQASDYDVAMEDLKNEVQADPDPDNWRQNFITQEAKKRAEIFQNIQDPRVKDALNLHVQKSLGRHVIDLSSKAITASHNKQLGNIEIVGNQLAQQAASTTDESDRSTYKNTFNSMIAGASQPTVIADKIVPPTLNPKQAEEARAKFEQKYLTYQADGDIERDASAFLQSAKTGKYDRLDPEKRRVLTSRANTAISSQIALEGRDQKQRQEKVDREIQQLFDSGAGADVIQAKLVASSAAGLIDRADRNFWDSKLIRGEKADDAVQIRNADKLRADFLEGGMPTGARIKDFRQRTRTMRGSGEIGDKGAAMVDNILIQAESHLNAEGRAQRSEGRAIESAARAREREGGGGKMSSAAAAQLIARPFPNSSPNNPQLAGHKADMKELLERSNAGIGTEDRGVVAKEIVDRRMKQVEAAKQQQKQRAEAAKTDPVAASILDRVKQLKQNK